MSTPSILHHSCCLLENGTITIGFLLGLLSKSKSNEYASEVITMNMKLCGRAPSHIPNILSTFHVDTEKRIICGSEAQSGRVRFSPRNPHTMFFHIS